MQTVRTECLDWTLLLGRHHLLRTLRSYLRHYNHQRPHRGLALAVPDPPDHGDLQQGPRPIRPHDVSCRDVLGGLIREYHAIAA
jgi:putative transposase